MEKPRILLINARSDIGGGPKYMMDFATAIEPDFDLWIASPLNKPFGPRFASIAKGHFAIPFRRFSLFVLIRLVFWAKKNRIHFVHSHGRGAGIYARIMKFFDFTVIHSFHGIHRETSILGKIKFWIDRLLNPLTDAFVFVSKSEMISALNAGFKFNVPFRIMYPTVEGYKPKKKSLHSPIQFGSISRLDPIKGLDLLLKHLSFFKVIHPEVHWIFLHAGAGDQKITIPPNILSNVVMRGEIESPSAFLNEVDIYLACSRNEAFNISVLEALSLGVPAIVSNVPGHEYFIESKTVASFELNNSNDFSNKLISLINSEVDQNSLNTFIEKHTSQQANKDLQSLFQDLN